MTNKEKMIRFIEENINKNNQHTNAIGYDGEYENEMIISTQGKMETYQRIVYEVIRLGGIVKKTEPATLEITVRFWEERKMEKIELINTYYESKAETRKGKDRLYVQYKEDGEDKVGYYYYEDEADIERELTDEEIIAGLVEEE